MGKVYIGVTAVGGHKLWGWWKERGLRGQVVWGNGWAMEGVTAGGGEVAGRACPAPTGWWRGERVLAGRCAGVGWFRAISVGGGVLDVPRRGQDPSLRCGVRRGAQNSNGWRRKVAGRACPAPTGAEGETGACWEVRGRGEFSHYNKRGEAGLSSTYLYSLLFMVHPVVFLIGRFAGQVHAEFL